MSTPQNTINDLSDRVSALTARLRLAEDTSKRITDDAQRIAAFALEQQAVIEALKSFAADLIWNGDGYNAETAHAAVEEFVNDVLRDYRAGKA
jgi:hypothetical protein